MIPPIIFRLLAAGLLAFLAGRFIIKEKAERKDVSNIWFNGVWAFVITVKLSLLLTHFSSIQNEPMLLVYGWGGNFNTGLGLLAVLLYYGWFVWKKAKNKNNEGLFLGISTAVFLLAFMVSASFFKPSHDSESLPENIANMENIDGDIIDYKSDQVTVLNFWATWCAPCRAEMPELDEFAKSHPDVNFITVNAIGTERNGVTGVRDFLAEKGYSFQVVLDHSGNLTSKYTVTSFPTTIVFDKNGNQIAKHVGVISESQLIGSVN